MRDLLLALTVVGVVVVGVGFPTASLGAQAEDDLAVLVYTRTAGFRHVSIVDGVVAVTRLGVEHGFTVEHSEDPAAFRDDNLARFGAVVFLNTTGAVLDDEGRAAFERYVRGGGAWVGVHSAADTEYDWPFYGELLGGAWFLSHPVQQPGLLENEAPDHPSTAHLPERWQIPFEEFYSFRRNPRPHVRVLLNIDEDSYDQDPNTTHIPDAESFPFPREGQTGVMGDHPMSWCQEVDDGHAWYTALGHESYLYQTPDFREHLLGGILTAAGRLDADCRVAGAQAPAEGPVAGPGAQPDSAVPPPRDPLPATGAAGLGLGALVLAALGSAAAGLSRGGPEDRRRR